jgi:hypothetical protein
MSLPADLAPLPTMPYDERPVELPLDVEECRTAIWIHRGNISEAAKRLRISPQRLRAFVKKSPRLQAEADEAREQLLDAAEDVAYEALTDEDPSRKDTMARFVLTNLGKDRGYGPKGGVNVSLNGPKGRLLVAWDDGTSIVGNDNDEKVIDADPA